MILSKDAAGCPSLFGHTREALILWTIRIGWWLQLNAQPNYGLDWKKALNELFHAIALVPSKLPSPPDLASVIQPMDLGVVALPKRPVLVGLYSGDEGTSRRRTRFTPIPVVNYENCLSKIPPLQADITYPPALGCHWTKHRPELATWRRVSPVQK